jgi:hypothetical protein
MRSPLRWTLAALLLTGCDSLLDPDDRLEPREVGARYEWVEQGWTDNGTRPIGQPSVVVSWALPDAWGGEPFRVYARRAAQGGYFLAATVTSCGESVCRYSDLNVAPGESYDYFVAAVDERADQEVASEAVRVEVPAHAAPGAPQGVTARGLDGAVWVRWTRAQGVERYRVFLKQEGSGAVFVEVGETDGSSFLDTRASNGQRYGYQVSAVDTLGRTGVQSALATAVPRPDYHAELVYPTADDASRAGFQFVATPETQDPVLSGFSPAAQWRVERSGADLLLVPLGQTRVTAGEFTTALTCGPGSDADCVETSAAPAASAFLATPVVASAGHSYVFRVTGGDGQPRYGKIRVQGRTTDSAGRSVLVFDWAYQLAPNEPALSRGAR